MPTPAPTPRPDGSGVLSPTPQKDVQPARPPMEKRRRTTSPIKTR